MSCRDDFTEYVGTPVSICVCVSVIIMSSSGIMSAYFVGATINSKHGSHRDYRSDPCHHALQPAKSRYCGVVRSCRVALSLSLSLPPSLSRCA